MSLFREVFGFLNFLNFASLLSFFWREMGLRHRRTRTQHSSIKKSKSILSCVHHRAVLLGIFLLFFWASPHKKKKNISKRLIITLSGESARQKRAVVRRDDENDDDRKGVSVRLVFFFVATKEEDEEGGRIARFVTFVCGFVQRHSSLSFSLSLVFCLSLSLERWN